MSEVPLQCRRSHNELAAREGGANVVHTESKKNVSGWPVRLGSERQALAGRFLMGEVSM